MVGRIQLEKGGLTRLAEITGASLTHLHFVLRGERKPSADLAAQIARYVGVPAHVLFPDVDLRAVTDGAEEPAP